MVALLSARVVGYVDPSPTGSDLQLPLNVADYYRVYSEPVVPNALREHVGVHGILSPLVLYVNGTHGVLRDGHQRLVLAREMGLVAVSVRIAPNWLEHLYEGCRLPTLEPLVSAWMDEHPEFGHAEHVTVREEVNPQMIKVHCSCGAHWREMMP